LTFLTAAVCDVVCRELGIQLRRDVKPGLDAAGVKLFLVSIGTWERSGQFADVTGFPRDCLLADPDSTTYEALGLVKGLRQTFFGSEVGACGLVENV
jgi:peroxiredoxin